MPAQLHLQSSITSTCLNTNLAHFSSFHAEHQFDVPFFSTKLKSVLKFYNYDPKFYKGHSFRIDAASGAAARGVPMATIQHMGRWKSDALKNYIRMPNVCVK